MSAGQGIKFVIKRVVKLLPFTVFILAFAMWMGPSMGAGPFWDAYDKAIKPCDTLWWTNLLFIQNLYPAEFDQKCMPWTWFLACYMQLTLVLPLIIGIFQFLPRLGGNVILAIVSVGFTVMNGFLVAEGGTGIFLTFDEGGRFDTSFYAKFFMRPYFHFTSYLWGVVLCMTFLRYIGERTS
jgi:peptidoglycan/LPS O-acetylase OafA/YrhL